jgi:hypothetical protein
LPEKRKNEPYLIEIFGKPEHRMGVLPLQNMMTSMRRIKSEIMRLPSFGTIELSQAQFCLELPPNGPSTNLMQRFQNSFGPFVMLIYTSSKTCESFSPNRESHCKVWYIFHGITLCMYVTHF